MKDNLLKHTLCCSTAWFEKDFQESKVCLALSPLLNLSCRGIDSLKGIVQSLSSVLRKASPIVPSY